MRIIRPQDRPDENFSGLGTDRANFATQQPEFRQGSSLVKEAVGSLLDVAVSVLTQVLVLVMGL